MGDGVEIWKGSVESWECDIMGHMNVGFYVVRATEALMGLAAELGMPRAFSPDALSTLMVGEHHIRFIREARPGVGLTMTGGVLEMGESDARLSMILRHSGGEIAASFETTVSHVTTRDGRPFPWPERVRARAEALRVEVPAGAGPRGLTPGPVNSQASGARAEALGVMRTIMGAIQPADCDVFGRMRPEVFMSRISQGVQNLFAGGRPGANGAKRAGGAAVEYRLIYLAWPRAGDRIELRSGLSGTDARVRRLTHWLLDPATGRPWGVSEAVVVSFDLDTRKVITLGDEALAAAQAQVIEGLTL